MSNGAPGRYASVNGLQMYYEIHGSGSPLVLLHGALSGIGTSFGLMLPSFATTRQVIAIEQQAHAHTPDIDRPLSYEQMTADTLALLDQLGIENADFFGYSMGGDIAMHIAVERPELVRKLIIATPAYDPAGMHPGLMEGASEVQPEHLVGSPFHDEYMTTAPNPDDFASLVAKIGQLNAAWEGWPEDVIRSVKAPVLLIAGDSDIVQPEHAVAMFRLLGGGVIGDLVGLPKSRLAILPGTTHVTLVHRADWIVSMVDEFLDAPLAE